jgi:glycosyltransferase involved in cell wall biosynthesis
MGSTRARPIKVAVLVDLERRPEAGGHVKCWERLAEAAARTDAEGGSQGGSWPAPVDLTVHFQGSPATSEQLAPHVRLVAHPPVFSSRRLPFLGDTPGHTDLSPHHPRLMKALEGVDVIHTTDAYFAHAQTASRAAKRYGAALMTSIHTETPAYTAVYADKAFRRVLGNWASDLLSERLRVPDRLAETMRRRLARYGRGCFRVLIGPQADPALARTMFGERVAVLRRGIDRARFNPARRDRVRLAVKLGIAPDRTVLFFAGRVDGGKSVMTLARATRILLARGHKVHALIAGEGRDAPAIRALLGYDASLPGNVPQDVAAWLYASSDLFVFPSRVEVAPNVVLEAKASGLPVIVAPGGGGVFVRTPGVDGAIVDSTDPAAWADAIAALIADPARRGAMAAAGQVDVTTNHPSWDDVYRQDLVPQWQAAWQAARQSAWQAAPESLQVVRSA